MPLVDLFHREPTALLHQVDESEIAGAEHDDVAIGDEEIRQAVGVSVREFEAGIDALAGADPPYLAVQLAGGWTKERAGGGYVEYSERTRRELGAWPTPDNLIEELVAALSRAADNETSESERSRLRAAAEVIGGMARDIAVGVVTTRLGQVG